MSNKSKSALMVILLASIAGCNKDTGIVGQTTTSGTEVKEQPLPIKRIVYANNALDENWFDNSNVAQMVGGQSNLGRMMAKNVYLILDASSTTTKSSCFGYGSKHQVMESAVFNFIDELPSNTNLGVIRFDANGPNEITSLKPVNGTFLKQLLSETNAGGENPVAITVSYAYKSLQKQAIKQQGYGEYHIVLLTDGGSDNESELLAATRTITESSPVVIHAYDFCPRSDNVLSSKSNIDYKPLLNEENLRNAIQNTFPRVSMSYDAPFKEGENDSSLGELEFDEQESSTGAIKSIDDVEVDQSTEADRDLAQEVTSQSKQEPEQEAHSELVDDTVSIDVKPSEAYSIEVHAAIAMEGSDHQQISDAKQELEANGFAKESLMPHKENESKLIEKSGEHKGVDKDEFKTEPDVVFKSAVEEAAETDTTDSLSSNVLQAEKEETPADQKGIISNAPSNESARSKAVVSDVEMDVTVVNEQ
ncbi:VWA domain-containing protein [Vibrio coralliilyticus]|uniref:VWFA domain-containing protein n=1 Tax=Vibrio coralliilyticus TaxID=190893 RepID=A0AAN0SKN4_9VIBR|nr:vWA domain-containing protein [Vibrio coralliilyticus]AIW22693.1 hypothetical protein IX92_26935 [Vibrio coralliilyticus]NOH36794.1 VWA domain-containing protein [Vibrio coralliilyticus]